MLVRLLVVRQSGHLAHDTQGRQPQSATVRTATCKSTKKQKLVFLVTCPADANKI